MPLVAEAAGPMAAEYQAAAARLAEHLTQLGAIAHTLNRHVESVDRMLPSFGFGNAKLAVDVADVRKVSKRWKDFEKALATDPTATLGAPS